MATITAPHQENLPQAKAWWLRPAAFDGVRVLLGLVLLTAAALKAWQLATEPTAEKGLLTSRWFLIVGVEVEFLLALWLLSGLYRRAARWAALGCFALFTGITLYKALSGEASCGCFGKLEVSPRYTLMLDLTVLALLWKCRRFDSCTQPVHRGGGPAFPRVRVFVILALAVGAAGAIGMASYVPASAGEAGLILSGSAFVALEPASWMGKRFPLLEHIDIGQQLAQGQWIVVLYRYDCSHCIETVPLYEQMAMDLAGHPDLPRIALVEVPPYSSVADQLVHDASPCVVGRLRDTGRWFVETPAGVALNGGYVLKGWQGEMPDPMEALATLVNAGA